MIMQRPSWQDMAYDAIYDLEKSDRKPVSSISIRKYIHSHFGPDFEVQRNKTYLSKALQKLVNDGVIVKKNMSYIIHRV